MAVLSFITAQPAESRKPQTPCRKGSPGRQRGLPFRAGSNHGSGCECVPGPKAIRAGCVREPDTGFHEKAVKLFLKFISHSFCGGGIVLPSGLRLSVHVLIRFFSPQKGGTLPSLYRSLCFRQCLAIVPNRPSSVKERIKKFPPNACRGERCGVWGRTAPSRPVQAMVGKDSYGSRDSRA